MLTDGPFAETRQQLGGYTLIDVSNLDEAFEAAAAFLGEDSWVTIEVRPIVDYTMPQVDAAAATDVDDPS